MIDPATFPEDIYKTLIALPYRVGLYVSMSDAGGGDEAFQKELAALENMVTFFVEDTLKSEFAQTVMLATLQNKINWHDWQADIEKVPQECSDIAGYLQDRLDARSLAAFKNNLIEIGITVAMAYREVSEKTSFLVKLRNCLSFHSTKAPNVDNKYLNISPSEKAAINMLAGKVGIAYKVA